MASEPALPPELLYLIDRKTCAPLPLAPGFHPSAESYAAALAAKPSVHSESLWLNRYWLMQNPGPWPVLAHEDDLRIASFFSGSKSLPEILLTPGDKGRVSAPKSQLCSQIAMDCSLLAWMAGPESVKACHAFLFPRHKGAAKAIDPSSLGPAGTFAIRAMDSDECFARLEANKTHRIFAKASVDACREILRRSCDAIGGRRNQPEDPALWDPTVKAWAARLKKAALSALPEPGAWRDPAAEQALLSVCLNMALKPGYPQRTLPTRVAFAAHCLEGLPISAKSYGVSLSGGHFGVGPDRAILRAGKPLFKSLISWLRLGKSLGWNPFDSSGWVDCSKAPLAQANAASKVFGKAPASFCRELSDALLRFPSPGALMDSAALRLAAGEKAYPKRHYARLLPETALAKACKRICEERNRASKAIEELSKQLFALQKEMLRRYCILVCAQRAGYGLGPADLSAIPEIDRSHLFCSMMDAQALKIAMSGSDPKDVAEQALLSLAGDGPWGPADPETEEDSGGAGAEGRRSPRSL